MLCRYALRMGTFSSWKHRGETEELRGFGWRCFESCSCQRAGEGASGVMRDGNHPVLKQIECSIIDINHIFVKSFFSPLEDLFRLQQISFRLFCEANNMGKFTDEGSVSTGAWMPLVTHPGLSFWEVETRLFETMPLLVLLQLQHACNCICTSLQEYIHSHIDLIWTSKLIETFVWKTL